MKNKKVVIISCIVGAIAIVAGILLIVLTSSKKSNKELFTEAVGKSLGFVTNTEDVANAAESTIKEVHDKISNQIYKLTLTGNVTNGEACFSKLDGTMYVGQDQFYVTTSINQNDTLYNLEGVLKDEKFYFYVKDVLSKFYYIENLADVVGSTDDSKIINKIFDYLVESFDETIVEENVKTDTVELTINGKTYKTDQYGYTFSRNSLYPMITKFANKVKNDSDILAYLNKSLKDNDVSGLEVNSEISKEEFGQMIDELLKYAEEVKTLGNIFSYNVYMYDDEVVSRQITVNIPSEQGNVPIKIADFKVTENGKGYYKLSVSAMGMEVGCLEVKQLNDNEANISVTSMGQELMKGSVVNNSNGIKVTLTSTDEYSNFSFELLINNDGTGSLVMNSEEQKMTMNYKVEAVDKIPEVDLANSEPYSEMPEEEKAALQEFLSKFNSLSSKDEVVILNDQGLEM